MSENGHLLKKHYKDKIKFISNTEGNEALNPNVGESESILSDYNGLNNNILDTDIEPLASQAFQYNNVFLPIILP
jgi:hypothetical protein